ncbi:GRP family sugar transporter [Bacteroidota bacterium]
MIIITNYWVAIMLCIITMLCWGSWSNTQKMVQGTWRFELYYWDVIIGIMLTSTISAFTIGSMGDVGRDFLTDLKQADTTSILYAMGGGLLWNAGNLLLVAAIAIAGMSVAFPIGGGIAWIFGIILNYVNIVMKGGIPSERPLLLWTGILIIIGAIFLSGKSYSDLEKNKKKQSKKGILISVLAGIFIAFYYPVTVNSFDAAFVLGGKGTLTPSTAIFFFSISVVVSSLLFNSILMRKPVAGPPVNIKQYFKGSFKVHMAGILGGVIWTFGLIFSYMAAGVANPAIAYALGNAAPVAAILWGIFVWKEFRGAPAGTNRLLTIMFIAYLIGLVLITISNA